MKSDFNTEIITNYLYENKLTKQEFCKRAKIGTSVLRKFLKKEGNINIKVLIKIANFIKIRIGDLFN